MQFSLPVVSSAYPESPASAPGAGSAPVSEQGNSFASLLPKGSPAVKQPVAKKPGDLDAEKAAAMMMAALWLPGTPPVAVAPLPTTPAGQENLNSLTAASNPLNAAAVVATDPAAVGALPLPAGGGQPMTADEKLQQAHASTVDCAGKQIGVGANAGAPNTSNLTAAAAKASTDSRSLAPAASDPAKAGGLRAVSNTQPATLNAASSAPDLDKLTVTSATKEAQASAPMPPAPADNVPGGEKIAAPLPTLVESALSVKTAGEKDFVVAAQKMVTSTGVTVGIGVAKVTPVMSAATSSRLKFAPANDAAPVASLLSALPSAGNATPETPSPAPTATLHDTLAAVASAVEALERRVDSAQKSVDLQFHVGDEHLSLRLELRDGTVHTTFSTQSTELRSALSEEWHSLVRPADGSMLRVADPVFNATSATGNGSASLGQGAAQQRNSNGSQAHATSHRPSLPANPAAANPAQPAVVSPRSTQLLHAFA